MPDSPPAAPSEVPSPALVASWERLGLLAPERVALWAAYWIAGGHDGDALRRLAGLHGDDPQEVHDALPQALMDCGVEMPDSDAAAATVLFTHLARLHVDGLAGPQWVTQKATQIVAASGCSASVMALPLARLYLVDDEWDGWGRPAEELAAIVRKACQEQLRSSSAA